MMTRPLYLSLDSAAIAREVSRAKRSVCYAAPGILQDPADGIANLARRIGLELSTVYLDFGERVMRDLFLFLGELIHDHAKHLAEILYRFFSGITPRCGSDGLESGTVRPECMVSGPRARHFRQRS